MKCENCQSTKDLHCQIHVLPCCPGKCPGTNAILTMQTKDCTWKIPHAWDPNEILPDIQLFGLLKPHVIDDEFWNVALNCKCLPMLESEMQPRAFYIDLITDDPIRVPVIPELVFLLKICCGDTDPSFPNADRWEIDPPKGIFHAG